jgi:hypothetical protein
MTLSTNASGHADTMPAGSWVVGRGSLNGVDYRKTISMKQYACPSRVSVQQRHLHHKCLV